MTQYDKILMVLNTDDPLGFSPNQDYQNEAKIIANIAINYMEFGDTIKGVDIQTVFEEFYFSGVMRNDRAEKIASMLRHPSIGLYQ